MAGPLVIGAEGVVLVPNKDTYGSSRPIEEGLELVLMLKEFPTSSTTVITHTEDKAAAEIWMKLNGLPKAAVVITHPVDVDLEPSEAQWHQIQRERARGPVNLVLTAFRDVYERCTQAHQPVLLFGRRGSVGSLDVPPSWDEVHARVQFSREANAERHLSSAESASVPFRPDS